MSNALMRILSLSEVWVGLLGLAAFLALFWVLRGSPIGQAVPAEDDEESPRGGYRDRVVAAVCVGMLLILSGGYLAVTKGVAWSLPAFGLGFATVLALVLLNERYRHGSPSLRRTLTVSTAALNLALVAGILVVVNVIAFRYGGRAIDMTREQAHSLSSLSLNQVKGLTRPVTFTTFFGKSGVAVQQKDRVDQLLDLYRAANPEMVHLDHVDPFREQARYDDLVKRVKEVEITQGGGVVVDYGEGETADHAVVRTRDLFPDLATARFDPDAASVKTAFKGEDAVTSALIRLREGKKPLIAFTTGHGEPSIDEMELARPGAGVWKTRLESTGWEVVAVNLLTTELPAATAVVVVDAPLTPFKPEEVARLKAFTDRKGPVLVLLDNAGPAALADYLRGFNVEVSGGAITEPRQRYRGQSDILLVRPDRSSNPIVEPLEDQQVLFGRPSPIRIVGLKQTNPALLTDVFLRTTRDSKVEKEAGPFNIGVAVVDAPFKGDTTPGTPRMVLLSSRYLAHNQGVQAFPPNLDLLMNSVNWLRGRTELVGIAPRVHESMTLTADPVLRARLVLVPTVMAFLSIICLGVVTYLARRS